MLDREKVGNAIATQRKRKGLTQRQLADMLNISYQAVSKWEQGSSLPSVDMIYDIAQILETTVDFLLNGLSTEKKTITYEDSGLDTKKLYTVKDRLGKLVSKHEALIHAHYADPVFFRLDTTQMEEPVCVYANHVPGSKERFAMEHGYDHEICLDVAANAANNLIHYGVRPTLLQAHVLCGNNDSGQLLIMGEAFKEFCDRNQMLFAGMEVAAQAVNYQPFEYKISASVIGTIDRKNIATGSNIAKGDLIIGLHSDGIYSTSYPFIKVMIDRKPEMTYAKVDARHTFMDALMKPNISYVNAVAELIEKRLIHGISPVHHSLYSHRLYRVIPDGLGACIRIDALPRLPLFQYLYSLNMLDNEPFLQKFSLGIGMLVFVSEEQRESAIAVIEKYHQYSIIGQVEPNSQYPDRKFRTEGTLKWSK